MASVSISFQSLEPGSSPLNSNKSPFYGKDRIDISGFSRRVSTQESDNSAPNQSTVNCSGGSSDILSGSTDATSHHHNNQPPHSQQQQHHGVSRKRSHSVHATAVVDWRGAKRRRKAAGGGGATFGPVRPTKFLLGGNISDPLNLGSLNDEEANRLANALTPVCSPIPTPKHRRERLEVIIPQDVSDPLGLNEPSMPTQGQRRCRRSGSTPSVDGPDGATVDGAKSAAEVGGEVSLLMTTTVTASGGGKKKRCKKRRKCASGPAASSTCEDVLSEAANPPAVEIISNLTQSGAHHSLVRSRSEGSGVVASCSASRETLLSSELVADACMSGATTAACSTTAVAALQDRTCPQTVQGSDEGSEDGVQESRRMLLVEIEPSLVSSSARRAEDGSVELKGTSLSLPSVAVSAASSSTLAGAAIADSLLSVVNQESTTSDTIASTAAAVVTSPPQKRRRVSYSAMPSDLAAVVSPAALQCAEAAASSSASASACGTRSGSVSSASAASRTSLCSAVQSTVVSVPRKNVFQYGNYNRYYGYRNGTESDPRLRLLKRQWLVGKDVLDLGCNVGDVTLTVARDYQPRRCVGLDIDSSLVKMARRNVRRYQRSDEFPASMVSLYGQLAPHCQLSGSRFPGNVSFVHANFVLESDAQLDTVRPEFDFIFCLSISKWIHLNFGDAGLRRFFRRAFLALRPGGRLLLEPQPWPSYMKKKKITPRIWENFQTIRLRPDAFPDLLLNEIGFQDYEPLGRPHHNNKGFNRQLQLYVKAEEGAPSPAANRVTSSDDLATQPGAEEIPPEVIPSDLPPGGEIPNQRPQV